MISKNSRSRHAKSTVEALEGRRLLSGNTPFLGTPFAPNQTILAVNYDKGGQGVAYHDTTPANLGGDNYRPGDAVDIQKGGSSGNKVGFAVAGEWLDYSITVTMAGRYKLEAAVANAGTGAAFHAEFEGTNLAGKNLTGKIAVPNTASKFEALTSATFNLTAGKTLMRIVLDKNSSAGVVGMFDWFKFVPLDGKDTPFLTGPFSINAMIPSADFDNGGEGVAYHDTTPANLGNDAHRPGDGVDIHTGGTFGNVISYAGAGEWINYTINVKAAGTYALLASVSNTGSGGSFHAEFEGTNLAGKNLTGAIAVPRTASWSSFQTARSATFTLPAGQTIMRIVLDKNATSDAVANFNYFEIVPA